MQHQRCKTQQLPGEPIPQPRVDRSSELDEVIALSRHRETASRMAYCNGRRHVETMQRVEVGYLYNWVS